ncbi:MAG: MoaD/ThiS family protein [Deltaproteobacteria bacterium]|nr:MoaD/ThiS family protein [Deltaproteobacteria bacterium]
MKLQILLFAGLRDRVGSASIAIDVPEPVHAGELLRYVLPDSTEAARWSSCTRVAVNHAYVAADYAIQPGDEVALIPPVAGG